MVIVVFIGMDHGTTGISFCLMSHDGEIIDIFKIDREDSKSGKVSAIDELSKRIDLNSVKLMAITYAMGDGISQILYTDVDGEENGGHFEDKIAQTGYMKKEKTGAGDGWYAGKYILSDEIRLYHKPAEDNTEEEGDEQPENEGNNE